MWAVQNTASPIRCNRDEGELVEGGGGYLRAPKLLGEQDSGCWLRDDIGYVPTTGSGHRVFEVRVAQGNFAEAVDLSLLDVIAIKGCRPVLAELLYETVM